MILSRKNDNPFIIIENIESLKSYFKFNKKFKIIEKNLNNQNKIEDVNNRRKLDAEVLSLISANIPPGKMLDIGTYLGHSATRMAINSPKSMIYTVNISPEEISNGGKLTTGLPEEIGSFYKKHKLKNIKQIFANTKNWVVPEEINDLSLVYVDGCHDKDFVYGDTKLIIDRVKKGGFILWHDCSPIYRDNFSWINESMLGIEKLLRKKVITKYILNVKNSWIGIWQKN